jgi:hypothetical protein
VNAWRLVYRNMLLYRRTKLVFLTGFLEPVLYLFSIGLGVGSLISGFSVDGRTIGYAAFVAPAMLASSAMNGAILDATYGVFFRLKYDKLYDAVLATPLTTGDVATGETLWSLIRGGIYSAAFLAVMTAMGLVESWWGAGRAAGDAADRVRLRRAGDVADDVHDLVAGLRDRHPGADADDAVQRHVLPGDHAGRAAAVGDRGDAAVPRGGPVP